jgi:hypothetical protein
MTQINIIRFQQENSFKEWRNIFYSWHRRARGKRYAVSPENHRATPITNIEIQCIKKIVKQGHRINRWISRYYLFLLSLTPRTKKMVKDALGLIVINISHHNLGACFLFRTAYCAKLTSTQMSPIYFQRWWTSLFEELIPSSALIKHSSIGHEISIYSY